MRVPRYVPPEDLALSDSAAERFLDDLEARAERYIPEFWTAEYVAVCLVEAADVIRRARLRVGPGALKAQGIAYNHDDLDYMEQRRNLEFNNQTLGTRSRPADPTREELKRADYVLAWPMRFLDSSADIAACVTSWAHWTACDLDVAAMADVHYIERRHAFDAQKNRGLQAIADGLNAAKEKPI